MCQFKSAIVTRDGAIFHHDLTDSHEDLIAIYGLREGIGAGYGSANFVRVELSPPSSDLSDQPDKYVCRLDENESPAWFDEAMREKTTAFLRGVIDRMIVSGWSSTRLWQREDRDVLIIQGHELESGLPDIQMK